MITQIDLEIEDFALTWDLFTTLKSSAKSKVKLEAIMSDKRRIYRA